MDSRLFLNNNHDIKYVILLCSMPVKAKQAADFGYLQNDI